MENLSINRYYYALSGPKYFTIQSEVPCDFTVKRGDHIVHHGQLKSIQYYGNSPRSLYRGDISSLNTEGQYTISITDQDDFQIELKDQGYSQLFKDSLRTFYYQRASMSIEKEFAGQWAREMGHPDNSVLLHHTSGEAERALSSPGGWYDAGDFGKYIVNGGISVGTLLSLYEYNPQLVGSDLNIPESNNGFSDLLNEVKYELDWMSTMQDSDGGVFFKLATIEWPGFIQPKDDHPQRYIIGKSTTSTLNFAAVMAQASRIYKNAVPEFSSNCLDQAKRAWDWAIEHPSVSHPPEIAGSGMYDDDSYEDEFFWACSELYISSENADEYAQYLTGSATIGNMSLQKRFNSPCITKPADWADVGNLGYYSFILNPDSLESSTLSRMKEALISYSETVIKQIESSPYDCPLLLEDFIWGSNGVVSNYGVLLAIAYRIEPGESYKQGLYSILNYCLGHNACGLSFVTGYGSKSPAHPHNRLIASDGIDACIPGFLVGGPNFNREDGLTYPGDYPEQSYLDDQESFASNETAINWSAPFSFLLGAIITSEESL